MELFELNQYNTIYEPAYMIAVSGKEIYPHLVLNPVPPLGHENVIASSVQTYQHDPHSMHKFRFFILAFPSAIS